MAVIRAERDADQRAVFEVNQEVFETDTEARLVDALREAAVAAISLVAEEDGAIVGHIFFSPVTVDGQKGDVGLMGLAPMAVRESLAVKPHKAIASTTTFGIDQRQRFRQAR